MEKININIYGGKSIFKGIKEVPVNADVIYCDKCDDCSFYKAGKCLRIRQSLNNNCIYGETTNIQGYTSRAKKYNEWYNKYSKDPVYQKLKAVGSERFAIIGDYYYLKTDFVDAAIDDEGSLAIATGNGRNFLKKENCTIDVFVKILTYKPLDMFGHIINSYQESQVPEIMRNIKFLKPDLFEKIIKKAPELNTSPCFVDKYVLVNTIPDGVIITDCHGNQFVKNGNELICEQYNGLLPFSSKVAKMIIPITSEMSFKVQNESQVGIDTKLA